MQRFLTFRVIITYVLAFICAYVDYTIDSEMEP